MTNPPIEIFKWLLLPVLAVLINPVNGADGEHQWRADQVQTGFTDSPAAPLAEHPTLADYLTTAAHNNPAVKSAWARWQAEVNSIAVARGLPNPTASLGYFLENIETAVGPQELKISLNQMLPWFGKLRLAGQLQTRTAEIAAEQVNTAVYQLKYRVTEIYLDYYFLQRSITLTQQNIALVRNWEKVVTSKYATARAGHPDLINTQIELLKLEDNLKTLEAQQSPLIEKFRLALNDKNLTEIIVPDSLDAIGRLLSQEEIVAIILESNPEFRIAELSRQASADNIKKARLNYYPDLGVGLDYIVTGEKLMSGTSGSGKDPLVVMVSASLPLWFKKNRSAVSAARYQYRATEERYIDLENRLRAEAEQAWFELEDARRKIALYGDGLIPKSLESLRATEKAYVADKLDFLNLVDAQRRYLQFLLEHERSLVAGQKAVARLELLAGRDL
ncbi:MAG: TolC family protein [Candidatus Neomarinimicrobiota bacterium]